MYFDCCNGITFFCGIYLKQILIVIILLID